MSCIFICSSSKVVDIKEPLRKPESQIIIHSTVKKSICALDAISTCRMPDIMIPLNQTWLIVYKDWIYVIFGNTVYIIHLHYFLEILFQWRTAWRPFLGKCSIYSDPLSPRPGREEVIIQRRLDFSKLACREICFYYLSQH